MHTPAGAWAAAGMAPWLCPLQLLCSRCCIRLQWGCRGCRCGAWLRPLLRMGQHQPPQKAGRQMQLWLGCLHSILQAVCSGAGELPGGSMDSVGSGSSSSAAARQGAVLHPAAAAAAAAEVAELEMAGLVQQYLLPRLQSALQASQSRLARTGASDAGLAADELQVLSLLEVDDLIPDYSSHPPGAWRPVPGMEPLTGTEASQGAADEEHPLALEPGLSGSSALQHRLLASAGALRQQQQQLESEDSCGWCCW